MTARDDAPPKTPPKTGRRRRLTGEERDLWRTVARSITPLRPQAPPDRDEAAVPDTPAPSVKSRIKSPRASAIRTEAKQPAKTVVPALETLARRDRKRVASGRHTIDARIDLHGRTQTEAYSALLSFIARSQSRGARMVLVITGKGTDRGGEGRGVLRRQVPMWLALPELRASVIGFEPAAPAHGGEGALYVRLRRPGGDRVV